MLNWIILGFFLAAIVWHLIRAICKPMIKNVLTLACIPIALLITSILHRFGLFKWGAEQILTKINLEESVSEIITKFLPVVSALLAPTLFVLVFNIIFWLLKILHVNLVTKYLKSRSIKREKKELKAAIREEKRRIATTIREAEERNRAIIDALPEEQQEEIISQYEPIDEDELEDMVDKRVEEEKKRRKKQGYFKESGEHKLISIFSGLLIGFLLFAISWTPLFYLMDIVSDVTDTVIEGAAYEEGDPKTKIYLAVEVLDEYLVTPYNNSPVIKLYNDTGMIDLLKNTVQKGSKIAEDPNGEPVYANEIAKLYLSRGARLACAMMDINYSDKFIREDMEDITINSPIYQNGVELIADFLVNYMEENPDFADSLINEGEDGEKDLVSLFLGEIIGIYKNGVVKDEIAADGTVTQVVIKTNKDVIKDDFNALTDIVIIFSENKLISKVMQSQAAEANLLSDREFISSIIVAASKLTPYKPAMETAFTYGIEMFGPMLQLPADNAAGYDLLISQLVSGTNNVTALTEADFAEIQKLFIAAAEYRINNGEINYLNGRIEEAEALIAKRNTIIALIAKVLGGEGLTPEDIAFIDANESLDIAYLKDLDGKALTDEEIEDLERKSVTQAYLIGDLNVELYGNGDEKIGLIEQREALEAERDASSIDTNILDYIADPLYVVELIKNEGLTMQDDGKAMEEQGKKLEADGDALATEVTDLEASINAVLEELAILELEYENDSITQEEYDAKKKELTDKKADFDKQIVELTAKKDKLIQDGQNFIAKGQVMVEKGKALADSASTYLEEAETRLAEFTPFLTYYMNWSSVQKPLLLAGEDKSSACLSVISNGKIYVCNTDEITIEDILDLVSKKDDLTGDIIDTGTGGDENEIPDISVDEYLEQIPFTDLFRSIRIVEINDSNYETYEGRVSHYTSLVSYLITSASEHKNVEGATEIDDAWLFAALSNYSTVVPSLETYIDDKSPELVEALLAVTEENKNEFDYKGMTLEAVVESLDFDSWDDPEFNHKANDTEHLVGIVFAFIDLMGKLGNQEEEAAPASESDSVLSGLGDTSALLEMLKNLGKTFDLMAETECLGDLPAVMMKSILTHPMLGQIMTTNMLYGEDGYLSDIDKIVYEYTLPEENRTIKTDENGNYVTDEDGNYVYEYTYANFMENFVGRINNLLEKFNTNEDDAGDGTVDGDGTIETGLNN